jgi:hypothetical protein
MFVRQVALTTESEDIGVDLDELMRVSAALQKQVARDFAPLWEVSATVDAFAKLEDVPLGYWRIVLVQSIPDAPGAAGIHLDKDGQPFALVDVGPSWSLTASHECLEMLGDPFGNRLIAGPSPNKKQGRVEFLVEVCDPSEAEDFAYTVNNTLVSDFYTTNYFDPEAASGVRYSFTGAIKEPRQVLRGGYLSWHEPVSDHWFQETFFNGQRKFRDLGPLARNGQSLRSVIDAKTPRTQKLSQLSHEAPIMALTAAARTGADESSVAKAKSLRSQITALRER